MASQKRGLCERLGEGVSENSKGAQEDKKDICLSGVGENIRQSGRETWKVMLGPKHRRSRTPGCDGFYL